LYKDLTHVKGKAFFYVHVEPILFLDRKEPEDGFIKAETWQL
jgi:hypothetical protein